MLSPATFIGIAKAAVGQPAPGQAPAPAGRGANVQQARILTTPPVAPPIAPQPLPKSAAPTLPSTQATPPRHLPRGSLLDLSV